MLDLLHENLRVVQEADHIVEAFSDTQQMCAELGAVHIFPADTGEQNSRLRKAFEDSVHRRCICVNYLSAVFRLQKYKATPPCLYFNFPLAYNNAMQILRTTKFSLRNPETSLYRTVQNVSRYH